MYLYGFIHCCTMCSLRKSWHSKSLTEVTAWTQLPHTPPWWKYVGAQSVHTPIRTSGWVDERGGGMGRFTCFERKDPQQQEGRGRRREGRSGGGGASKRAWKQIVSNENYIVLIVHVPVNARLMRETGHWICALESTMRNTGGCCTRHLTVQ